MSKKEFILSQLKELAFEMYVECHKGLYYDGEGEYDEEKSEAEWSEWQQKMETIISDDEWLYEMENK